VAVPHADTTLAGANAEGKKDAAVGHAHQMRGAAARRGQRAWPWAMGSFRRRFVYFICDFHTKNMLRPTPLIN
jgi:hypothetical protein